MLRYKYKCKEPGCECTGWARGWDEPDVNAGGICEDDPMEDACEHIRNGGDYDLVDSEYDSDED